MLLTIKHKQAIAIAIIFLITLVILMVIPIGSSIVNNMFVVGFRLDYIIHSLIYLPWMLVGKTIFNVNFKPLLWLIAGILFVVLLEIIQFVIPYRSFNIYDLIAGFIGILLSYFIFKLAKLLNDKNTKTL